MRRLGLVLVLALVAAGAVAEDQGKYWVVGSFASADAAQAESQRIADRTGQTVAVSRNDIASGTVFRVVVPVSDDPARQKQVLETAGLAPWQMNMAASVVAESATDSAAMSAPPSLAAAGMGYVLVVAAFNQAPMAERYARELSGRSDAFVSAIPARSNGRDVYRVVLGPYPNKTGAAEQNAVNLGISGAWWAKAPMPEPVEVAPPPAPPMVAAAPPEPPPAPPELPPAPKLRAPAPGESYFDYCINKANPEERARYCEDNQFSKAALSQQQVMQGGGGPMYVDFCTHLATGEQRARYCENGLFTSRALPD